MPRLVVVIIAKTYKVFVEVRRDFGHCCIVHVCAQDYNVMMTRMGMGRTRKTIIIIII